MANDLLRGHREATSSASRGDRAMTRVELAEAVNHHIWTTTGKRICLDADTIARYERGQIRWPSATYRQGLRAVLGVERDSDLGFFPTRRGKAAAPDFGAWVAGWSARHKPANSSRPKSSETGMADLCRVVQEGPSNSAAGLIAKNSPPTGRRQVASAFEAYQAGRYQDAAGQAATALDVLRRESSPDPRVLALAYQIAAIVLGKAGCTDAAELAAERGVIAAEAAGDPRLRLSLGRTAAFTMYVTGRRDDALSSIAEATADFAPRMSETPLSASVYGTMLLTGALLAAGEGDHVLAEDYLDEAERAAQVTGTDRNDLWTAFGPSNVAIHRTNVAAAMGDMDAALANGGPLRVEHLPAERRVRLHLDIARASLAVGNREDALATLVRAEMTASAQVRHHYIARDVVHRLISSTPGRPGVELTRLAELAGVDFAHVVGRPGPSGT